MCGRYTLSASQDEIAEQFGVDDVVAGEAPPRYNVAPSQLVFAVAASADGSRRRLGELQWGLVPSWATDPSIGNRLVNARAETAATRPAFRGAFARRRCLLPASGYYEWQAGTAGGGARRRIPFYFRRRDGRLLAIGGLWEVWHGPEDRTLRTCTILTTAANELGATVHDRMPVLVPEELWGPWLAPGPLDEAEREAAVAPVPDDLLVAVRVADRVNDPRNDGKELVEPVGDGDGDPP
jgi:putative SOS response-associated peptidase YedK